MVYSFCILGRWCPIQLTAAHRPCCCLKVCDSKMWTSECCSPLLPFQPSLLLSFSSALYDWLPNFNQNVRGLSVVFNKNNSVLFGKSTSDIPFLLFFMKHLWFSQDTTFVLALVKQISYIDIERNFSGDCKCIRHHKVWLVYLLTRCPSLFLVQLPTVQDVALAEKAVWVWYDFSSAPEWNFADQRSLAKAWRSKLKQRLRDDTLVTILVVF